MWSGWRIGTAGSEPADVREVGVEHRGTETGPEDASYPRTWLLLDFVDRQPRLLGKEVVDLSPAAIELRRAARELRGFAETPSRFLQVGAESNVASAGEGHRRRLSFGPDLRYVVEHDPRGEIHAGEPFRHLRVEFASRVLTPATAAEIGRYFYGRRPAVFARTGQDLTHGFIGMDWGSLSQPDVLSLLEREAGRTGDD